MSRRLRSGLVLAAADLVAFVPTTDLARARSFYGDQLGLPVLDESGFALVLDAHGTRLRVTLVDQVAAAPYTIVGWVVPDIASAVRALAAGGVRWERFAGMEQDEMGVWTSPGGDRVAWFKDPDGNTLSLTEVV